MKKKRLVHQKRLTTLFLATFFLAASILQLLQSPQAYGLSGNDFQAGNIISDTIFYNKSAMSEGQIQTFLNIKGAYCNNNCLKDYSQSTPNRAADSYCGAYPGGAKSSARIIYDVAQACNINPQVILTLLQKEQSLVTSTSPSATQYRSATGYGCPDSAACDSTYYGFFNQVYWGSWQYKRYQLRANEYSYRAGRNNTILWNPVSSCGSSTVYIQTQATAGLYIYTPYRPNQAALDNLYGTGNSCSSYGNRNFWRIFNDWFGSSVNQIQYVQVDGGSGQYLIYDGKKQALTYDGLLAWSLHRLPLTTLPAETLNKIPSTPTPLTRYGTVEGTSSKVFADKAYYYDVNDNTRQSWGSFKNIANSVVPWKLLQFSNYGGNLPSFATSPDDSRVFAMENGTLQPISGPTVFRTWAGQHPAAISLTSQYVQDVPIGSGISHNIVSNKNTLYYLDGRGRALRVPDSNKGLFSAFTPLPVTDGTLRRYSSGGLSHLVKAVDGTTIYAIDKSSKRKINTFQVFNALRNSSAYETQVTSDALKLLPQGSDISSAILREEGTENYYLANSKLSQMPARLVGEFDPSDTATIISPTFINLFSKTPSPMSQFIKKPNSAGVYFVNNGVKHPIARYDVLEVLGGSSSLSTLPETDFSSIPTSSQVMSPLVKTTSSSSFLVDKNTIYAVPDESTRLSWNLNTTPITISQATYDWLTSTRASQPLSRHLQAPNGEFCFADISRYCAEQHQMIFVWNLQAGVIHPSESLLRYTNMKRSGALSRFLVAKGDTKILTMDRGDLYWVSSPDALVNLGYDGKPYAVIQKSTLDAMTYTKVHPYQLQENSNVWIIDKGVRRKIPSSVQTNWSDTLNPPTTISSAYLSFLPVGQDITKSITTASPGAIYAIDQGKKRGISTYQKYQEQGWAPHSVVSPHLIKLIPTGDDI